jgi:DNA mismatch repair protein MutH
MVAPAEPFAVAPPRDEAELAVRANALRGVSIDALASRLGRSVAGAPVATKGKVGELLEHALGATGGSNATWDFPALRVELKTVPIGPAGVPRESTFVCSVSLLDAERAEWETSWVRAKLARVLWVPVVGGAETGARVVGEPRLWSPTEEQARVLAADFEEILGRVAVGGIEGLSARVGRWLQLRPKAAHGRVRTGAPGRDGERVSTVPRGFYLRARFTGAILADPRALP